MNQIEQIILSKVENLLKQDASGHNIDHILRVYHMALHISNQEGGNQELIAYASLLHDVDDDKLFHGKSNHANKIMEEIGLSIDTIKQVNAIISKVSYTKQKDNSPPDLLEAKIVQDADRLDAIGAIGIARAFAYGGSRGRPLFGDNQNSSEKHFYDKLLKLKDLMNTETAMKMALKRHQFLILYIQTLNEERNINKQ